MRQPRTFAHVTVRRQSRKIRRQPGEPVFPKASRLSDGVPQRPGGLSRAEYNAAREDEERRRSEREEEDRRRREAHVRALEAAAAAQRHPNLIIPTLTAIPAPPPPAPLGPAPAAYQAGPYPPPPPNRHAVPTYPPAFLPSAPIRPVPSAQHTFVPPPMQHMTGVPAPPQTNAVQPEQVPKLERPPGLSRFAELYVPMWLRRVNADPPVAVIPRSAAEAFNIDHSTLHDSLYPPQLLHHLNEIERRNRVRISDMTKKTDTLAGHGFKSALAAHGFKSPKAALEELSPAAYARHWLPLQQAEYTARGLQLQQAALYGVPLRPRPRHPGEPVGPPLYTLEARSIREGWPPVDLGDVLSIRQLRPQYQSWQGLEFHASVAGINRAAGEVLLRCDGLLQYQEAMVFNVVWRVQDRIFSEWRHSCELLDLYLTSDPLLADIEQTSGKRKRTAVESWLFPDHSDVALTAPPPEDADLECDWVDASLNEEQKNAVRSILWGKQRLPLLLHGPPGTGKTKTLVEAIFQILKRHPDTHILVCGASNPSTDTLAMRLRSLMPKDLFRLNAPSRPFAEVRGELLPFCHVENDRFAMPSMSTLLSKRVICTTVLDASILLRSRITNHDLSTLEIYVSGSIHPNNPPPLAKPHFGYLLVDEAAQATEADIACALNVVATDDTRCHRAHVTVCGDARQLGPHIVSEEARNQDFDVSLLERLMDRPVYAEHPFARRNRARNPDERWDIRTTPFVDLVRNYRSAPEILWLPSTLFYAETLVPCAARSVQQSSLRAWPRLPNPGFPIIFQHVAGDDLEVDEGASFFNDLEVQAVRDHILALVRPPPDKAAHGMVSAKEISVISPFREQVWRIRLALRAVGLGEVDVGNVEALQGAENRIVIISTVRSKEMRWLPIDRAQNRGLIHEPKRFNVAMTRAKELLIVIGNANTLTMDPWWLAFYRLCIRNDCYVGPPVTTSAAQEAGHAVSRLEQQYHAERSASGSPALGSTSREDGTDESTANGSKATPDERAFDILIGRLVSATVNEDEA
ncbi:P-loop containing nucleoside triphosphate hydrolase protein [Rhodotorula sp. JG-1b]|nr:P-loop containing nucleoside triphosphate hydrolase protein [Rhodotorula sp. JG-1b]